MAPAHTDVQAPWLQNWSAPQTFPQAPQFWGFSFSLTQALRQVVSVKVHEPDTHLKQQEKLLTQAPQMSWTVLRSTQMSPQRLPWQLGAYSRFEVVGVHRDSAISRERSAYHLYPGCQGHAGQREDISNELRRSSYRLGATDLPKRIAAPGSVSQAHRSVARRRERAPELEDEGRIRTALRIERERSGQLSRRREAVDGGVSVRLPRSWPVRSWSQALPASVSICRQMRYELSLLDLLARTISVRYRVRS